MAMAAGLIAVQPYVQLQDSCLLPDHVNTALILQNAQWR